MKKQQTLKNNRCCSGYGKRTNEVVYENPMYQQAGKRKKKSRRRKSRRRKSRRRKSRRK